MAGVGEVAVVEVAAGEHAVAFITEVERTDGDRTLHAIVFSLAVGAIVLRKELPT